ncbi:unnamed protein product [Brassica oleracea]
MTDKSSVDGILEFLKRICFSKAEEALRNELNNSSDLNGFLQKLNLEEYDCERDSRLWDWHHWVCNQMGKR